MDATDITGLSDDALISQRAEVREELQRLPERSPARAALAALYDEMTGEFDRRAAAAWAGPELRRR